MPPADSPEMKYLHERRQALGGYLPQRRRKADDARRRCRRSPRSTQVLQGLGRRPRDLHHHGVRAHPHRAGARQGASASASCRSCPTRRAPSAWKACSGSSASTRAEGQKYEPVDKDQVMYYREDKAGPDPRGRHQRGGRVLLVDRGGDLVQPLATQVTVPFYIFYSMFGLQRIGDLAWAAGDQRARGFLLGATAGRTTLNGEGLQHEDGHCHILSSVIPNCVSYDPTYGYELAVIIHDGLRRMVDQPGGCVLLHHRDERELRAPGHARGRRRQGSSRACTCCASRRRKAKAARAAAGLGHDPARSRSPRPSCSRRTGVSPPTSGARPASPTAPRRPRAERWNLLHPEDKPRVPYVTQCLAKRAGPVVAATDYMKTFADQIRPFVPRDRVYRVLGTDGFGRSDSRAQAAPLLRGEPLLRRDRGAEGAGRAGRGQGEDGRRGDQEVRHRSRTSRIRPPYEGGRSSRTSGTSRKSRSSRSW